VLPTRKCFVVTSTSLPRNNAIAVKTIGDVDRYVLDDMDKTVFFIGGEGIYREGIAKCDELFITVVNKECGCDRYFPTSYVEKYFDMVNNTTTHKELAFTQWRRKS
jgi:dihydrofolate reductase